MTDPRRLAGSVPVSAVVYRTIAVIAAIGAVSTAIAAVVATIMARTVVIPPMKREQDVMVLGVSHDVKTVDLSATEDGAIDGAYSLWFNDDSGHATVGGIVAIGPDRITRRLLGVSAGVLSAGVRGRFASWFYMAPEDLGFPFTNVVVESDVGSCPAWLIPADPAAATTGRWVIQVHGRATQRQEGLRAVPVFRAAGLSSLLVSYRNDTDAPASVDGRFSLGDTEWLDVEAAIRFAAVHGASDIILMGWSMGGAICLQTVTRSDLGHLVSGVILESPVIDWVDTLTFQAGLSRLPGFIGRAAMVILGHSLGGILTGQSDPIDLKRLDFVSRAKELALPILILHSDDDGYVPSGPSHALAEARPDIVTLESFTVARHTRLWNYDRDRWNSIIEAWLRRLRASAPESAP